MSDFIEVYTRPETERFIFGCTEEAEKLIQIFNDRGLDIKAVIDTYYPHNEFFGVPRITLDDVPGASYVVSAVTNSRPVDVNKLLASRQMHFVDYFYFYRMSGFDCPEIPYWDNPIQHYLDNKSDYARVRSLLADEESRQVFDAIVQFRNSYDLTYMNEFSFDIGGMYFEEFLPDFGDQAIFFDLGAYDGSNSRNFIERHPSGRSYLFEPIPEAKEKLKKRFFNDKRYCVINMAVGRSSGLVNFNVSGTSSKVSDDQCAGLKVEMITIDLFAKKEVVFPHYIKMDVEGFEPEVLHGAKSTILNYQPALAVSVYHKVEHLVELPLLLADWVEGYSFYLRHYTQGYSETVLFAIPCSK